MYAATEFTRSSPFGLGTVLKNRELIDSWASLFVAKVDLQVAALHGLAKILDTRISPAATDSCLPEDTVRTDSVVEAVKLGGGRGEGGAGAESIRDLVDVDEDTKAADRMKAQLFEALGTARGPSTMAYLLKLLRQPISQLRNAALDVFRALAAQPGGWGLQIIFASHEFKECMTNDVALNMSDSRQWKFAVVQAATANPQLHMLNEELVRDLQAAVARGPNYVRANTDDVLTMER